MRSTACSLTLAALAIAAAAGCGRDTGTDVAPTATSTTESLVTTPTTVATVATTPGSTGPTAEPGLPETGEVIRFVTQPLFPVIAPYLSRGPDVLVYADGTIYTPTMVAFAAAPWAWPYEVAHTSRDDVLELFTTAAELGLLGPGEALLPRTDVADAPLTRLEFVTTAGPFRHRVELLASPPADDPTGYYMRIQQFSAALAALVERSLEPAGDFYQATAFAVVAAPTTADVYTAEEWPGSVPLAELTTCQIIDDPALVERFVGGSAGGAAFADDGVIYSIAVATAFPGQTTC